MWLHDYLRSRLKPQPPNRPCASPSSDPPPPVNPNNCPHHSPSWVDCLDGHVGILCAQPAVWPRMCQISADPPNTGGVRRSTQRTGSGGHNSSTRAHGAALHNCPNRPYHRRSAHTRHSTPRHVIIYILTLPPRCAALQKLFCRRQIKPDRKHTRIMTLALDGAPRTRRLWLPHTDSSTLRSPPMHV